MSYFVTISGASAHVDLIKTADLIPAANAQYYVSALDLTFLERDGGSVFLLHDGETGTSDDLVGGAIEAIHEGSDFLDTELGQALTRLAHESVVVRIWDAGAVNPLSDEPQEANGIESLTSLFVKMAMTGRVKYIRSRFVAS